MSQDSKKQKSTASKMKWSFSRRQVLAGGTALTVASFGPWKIAHANEQLIVNALAGPQSDATEKYICRPFEEKFKVKIVMDHTGTAAQDYAKIRATGGNPGWDVNASLTPDVLYLGEREGLLEPLNEERVPNLKHLWPQVWDHVSRSSAPFGVQYLGIHYNKDRMEKPESWLDYWKPQNKYGDEAKGKLLMVRPTNLISIYAMMLATIADGGSPEDLSPTWKMMTEARDYFGQTVGAITQVEPMFNNGELWMTPQWSTRAKVERDRGSPLEFVLPKEGTLPLLSASAVPIGAREKELAYEWINFRLDEDIHRDFCLGYEIGPTRNDITDWPEYFTQDQITTEDGVNKLARADPELMATKRNEWTEKWQEIMGA